jgi:hypothetical protein
MGFLEEDEDVEVEDEMLQECEAELLSIKSNQTDIAHLI